MPRNRCIRGSRCCLNGPIVRRVHSTDLDWSFETCIRQIWTDRLKRSFDRSGLIVLHLFDRSGLIVWHVNSDRFEVTFRRVYSTDSRRCVWEGWHQDPSRNSATWLDHSWRLDTLRMGSSPWAPHSLSTGQISLAFFAKRCSFWRHWLTMCPLVYFGHMQASKAAALVAIIWRSSPHLFWSLRWTSHLCFVIPFSAFVVVWCRDLDTKWNDYKTTFRARIENNFVHVMLYRDFDARCIAYLFVV